MTTPKLVIPTPELVKKYVELIKNDKQFCSEKKALSHLLDKFPMNRRVEEVIIKAAAIDSIYHTHSGDYIVPFAERIVELQIDKHLKRKSTEIVNAVASVPLKGGKQRSLYVMATKYCWFHNPDAYPIFDTIVGWLIGQYRDSFKFAQFSNEELRNYPRYKEIMECFRTTYRLTQFNFTQLDNFLWGYGRALMRAQRKNIVKWHQS